MNGAAFGILQVGLGVVLIGSAALWGGPFWSLAWPGASVLVVGVGYLGIGAAIFGKRTDDGGRSPVVVFLMWPYLLVAWLLWQLKSRLRSEAAYHEVAPNILVGRRPLNADEFPRNTRWVVDLTSEFARSPHTAGAEHYACLPTLDISAAPSDRFRALVCRIAPITDEPLFIHCAMGHGRSASVAAALMILRGHATDVGDATKKMRAIRPLIHLHGAQRRAASDSVTGHDHPSDRPDRAPDPS